MSLLLGSALVWGSTESAFKANTSTGSNSWATGTVTITNDQSGTAIFSTPTNLQPDNSLTALSPPASGAYNASTTSNGGSRCVKVTYSGSLPGRVHMYATQTGSSTLAAAMLFTVDKGTDSSGSSDVNCATYTSSSYVYGSSGTTSDFLSAFPSTFGVIGAAGEWTVAGGSTVTQWYRIAWLLPSGASAATAGQTLNATFTWEIQST